MLYTSYDVCSQQHCVFCRLVIEYTPVGSIMTSASIRNLKKVVYSTMFDYIALGFQIVFAVFTLYYLMETLVEVWTRCLVDLSVTENFCCPYTPHRYTLNYFYALAASSCCESSIVPA